MRPIVKKLLNRVYKPLVVRYLRKDRQYSRDGVQLLVKKGVFHPGFFYSTNALLRVLKKEELCDKHVLEIGAGSGMLSFYAARKEARVTATDVNPAVIDGLRHNLEMDVSIDPRRFTIIRSDLFDDIPRQHFDYILINPPYYRGDPRNEEEKAWYCGENFEYFEKLFGQLPHYISAQTRVLMSLSNDCDLPAIMDMAHRQGLHFGEQSRKTVLGETTYIYRITQVPNGTPEATPSEDIREKLTDRDEQQVKPSR